MKKHHEIEWDIEKQEGGVVIMRPDKEIENNFPTCHMIEFEKNKMA